MGEIGFPLKDLARRKFQTVLTVVALTLCVASTIFLVLLGQSLGFQVPLFAEGKLTTGFSRIFSGFIIVISFLNVLAGAMITYFLVSNTMSQRTRDIGIMKAAGCLTETAFGYFATELFIIVFTSCVAGIFLGVLMTHLCIGFNILGLPTGQVSINVWTVVVVFLVFVLTAHVFGVLPIVKTIKMGTVQALLPHYLRGVPPKLGKFRLSKLGFSFKAAYRALMRRKPATLQTTACLSIVLTLTAIMFVGGTVANETTQSYLQRAIGENVVLVGHPELVEHYLNLLSLASEAPQTALVDCLDSKYRISADIVSKLNATSGVVETDPRLVLQETVYEVPEVAIQDGGYIRIGDHRSDEAFIVGVNSEHLINDWLIFGRTLNKTDVCSAVVGDSLASKILACPTAQSIELLRKNFQVVGVCLDPINNGNVVYTTLQALFPLIQQTDYNVVLLKIDPSNRSEVISAIKDEIRKAGLQLAELDIVLEEHQMFFNSLWSAVTFLPLFSLAVATICLASFMVLCVKEQQHEFGIMRALGAKPSTIIKIILAESSCITLTAGIIGILIGSLIAFTFLIPEPVISHQSLLRATAALLLVLSVLNLSSLYPAHSIVKKTAANILSTS